MIVGLTGGIGAGKTTVAKIFESLRIPVYEADLHSKTLIDTDLELQSRLSDLLGADIVVDGKIDRPKMASLIFNNKELLASVNAIIHPAVGLHFKNWVSEQSSPYLIKEAAILFESGSYKSCDKVVTVTAPEEMRIERVMKRNNISREEVLVRINKQWPEQKKIDLADFVIYNDHKASLINQVLEVHENLIRSTN